MAPTTSGTTPAGVGKPTPRASRCAIAPKTASRPKALPPARTTAWIRSARWRGSSRSRPATPEAQPRTSTPATAPSGQRIAVQPVAPTGSEAWPTRSPGTSVSVEIRDLPLPPRLHPPDGQEGRLLLPGGGADRAWHATDLVGGEATQGDLAGHLQATLDQRPYERDTAGRGVGIRQGPGHRHRLPGLGGPSRRVQHERLLLEPTLPEPPRVGAEVGVDRPVDQGGMALRLHMVGDDEAALLGLQELQRLALDGRR